MICSDENRFLALSTSLIPAKSYHKGWSPMRGQVTGEAPLVKKITQGLVDQSGARQPFYVLARSTISESFFFLLVLICDKTMSHYLYMVFIIVPS